MYSARKRKLQAVYVSTDVKSNLIKQRERERERERGREREREASKFIFFKVQIIHKN